MDSFLADCIGYMGVETDASKTETLARFRDCVLETNKKFNLTAITDEREFDVKHIADSLVAVSEIPFGARLCDIGAGAGFPSFPIAVARRDVSVTALDSTAKKMNFLKDCAATLDVGNLDTVIGRAEEQKSLFSTFDVVTARAVSSLSVLLELSMPLLKVGGKFIAYKTDESELPSARNALAALNAKHVSTKNVTLPNGDRRAILVFEKTDKTPARFPRKYGAIKNSPL